jgi:hypothetical protein
LKGFKELDFGTGVLIENWDLTAWIKATNPECGGTPDDVLQNHLGLRIYSTKSNTSSYLRNQEPRAGPSKGAASSAVGSRTGSRAAC